MLLRTDEKSVKWLMGLAFKFSKVEYLVLDIGTGTLAIGKTSL